MLPYECRFLALNAMPCRSVRKVVSTTVLAIVLVITVLASGAAAERDWHDSDGWGTHTDALKQLNEWNILEGDRLWKGGGMRVRSVPMSPSRVG